MCSAINSLLRGTRKWSRKAREPQSTASPIELTGSKLNSCCCKKKDTMKLRSHWNHIFLHFCFLRFPLLWWQQITACNFRAIPVWGAIRRTNWHCHFARLQWCVSTFPRGIHYVSCWTSQPSCANCDRAAGMIHQLMLRVSRATVCFLLVYSLVDRSMSVSPPVCTREKMQRFLHTNSVWTPFGNFSMIQLTRVIYQTLHFRTMNMKITTWVTAFVKRAFLQLISIVSDPRTKVLTRVHYLWLKPGVREHVL